MSKGRRVPPPAPKQEPRILTPEEASKMLAHNPGVYVLTTLHDPRCPTIKTQNADLCTCKQVEQTLRRVEDK